MATTANLFAPERNSIPTVRDELFLPRGMLPAQRAIAHIGIIYKKSPRLSIWTPLAAMRAAPPRIAANSHPTLTGGRHCDPGPANHPHNVVTRLIHPNYRAAALRTSVARAQYQGVLSGEPLPVGKGTGTASLPGRRRNGRASAGFLGHFSGSPKMVAVRGDLYNSLGEMRLSL